MGIYVLLSVLTEWLGIVLAIFPGYADFIHDLWFRTDREVDDLLR